MAWWFILLPPAIWIAICLFKGFWEGIRDQPRKVSDEYKDNLVIGFYGEASAGKSSAIRALYGKSSDSIHPIPGTTKDVKVYSMDEDTIMVADTPGLLDINRESSNKAKEFIDNVDIFIYIVNASTGITEKVEVEIDNLKKIGRPLLIVLNKIDTIPKNKKRTEFIKHQSEVAKVEKDNFIEAAFDPLPQITNEPVNVDKVRQRINKIRNDEADKLLEKKSN